MVEALSLRKGVCHLVSVVALAEFEAPADHEEQGDSNTDVEDPPADGDAEDEDRCTGTEAEWPPAPWGERTVGSGVIFDFSFFAVHWAFAQRFGGLTCVPSGHECEHHEDGNHGDTDWLAELRNQRVEDESGDEEDPEDPVNL